MVDVVNINTDTLIQAAEIVANHLAGAAMPPAGALPPAAAPSPADIAAAGVAELVQARIASASTGLADKSPLLTGVTIDASGGLQLLDADNAWRIAAVRDDNPHIGRRG